MSHRAVTLSPVDSTPPYTSDGAVTGDQPAPDPIVASVPAPRTPAELIGSETTRLDSEREVVDAEMVSDSMPAGDMLRAEVVSTGLDPTVAIPPDYPVAGARPMATNVTYGWPEMTATDGMTTVPAVAPVTSPPAFAVTTEFTEWPAVSEPVAFTGQSFVTEQRVVSESPAAAASPSAADPQAPIADPTVALPPPIADPTVALPPPIADPTVALPPPFATPTTTTPTTAVPYSGVPYSGMPYSGTPYTPYQPPQSPTYGAAGYPPPGYAAQQGYTAQPGYTPQPGYAAQPGYAPGYAPPGYPVPSQYAPPATYPGAPAGYPPAPPGTYPPYYPPEPPRRRRGLLISGIIAGIVVVALCAGLIAYSVPTLLHSGSTPTPTAAGASPDSTAGSGVVTDDDLFQRALDAQGAALLKGDQSGWLAAVDPAATSAVSAYKRLYHNLTQLHVQLWKPSSSDFVELSGVKQTFSVGVNYCFGTDSCSGTRASLKVTALKRDGKVIFEGIAAPKASLLTNQPLPWEVANLTAVVGKRVIVAASSAWSFKLQSALATAEKAAEAADKYAQWGRPTTYVVYLANSTEGKTWFDGDLKHVDGVSYTISPTDIQIVIMMPFAAEVGYAGPGGLNTVIQHEMGHVVTLWAATDRPNDHDSFIEGIAEYIAYNGHTSWAKYRIADTRAYIRGHKFTKCYLTSEITADSVLASSAAYGIGYLAMKYLAGKYGQTKMLSFWGDVERDGKSLDAASQLEFGKPWSSVNSSCVSYVRHSVGA